jgi:hypothetical protein
MDSYTIQFFAPMALEPRRKFPKFRICRFCKLDSNSTTFNSDSHTIPHSLGNKYDISDYECDKCNNLFSKYESDLIEYFGINRTIFSVQGKNKNPKYKSNSLNAEVKDLDIAKKTIVITNKSSNNIEFDDITGEAKLKYSKNRYTPINVYKAFLKMALSMIPESEVDNYKQAFKFLLSDESNEYIQTIAKVHQSNINYESKLHCYILKKKNPDLPVFSHLFIIYLKGWIFQFFLPYNPNDNCMFDGIAKTLNYCPPIFFHIPPEQSCTNVILDLSDTEKTSKEGFLNLTFDPKIFSEMMGIDPKTGKTKTSENFLETGISKILLVPNDTKINFEEIKKIKFKDL